MHGLKKLSMYGYQVCGAVATRFSLICTQIKMFLKPLEGAVVLTFGAGNGPDKDEAILEAFTHASKTTLMLNITQCLKGRVADAYATGTVSKLLSADMSDMDQTIIFRSLNPYHGSKSAFDKCMYLGSALIIHENSYRTTSMYWQGRIDLPI